MSSGFYLVSGLLYMNMGCEIMFVLANRMRAQNVDMKASYYIVTQSDLKFYVTSLAGCLNHRSYKVC